MFGRNATKILLIFGFSLDQKCLYLIESKFDLSLFNNYIFNCNPIIVSKEVRKSTNHELGATGLHLRWSPVAAAIIVFVVFRYRF